MRTGTRTTLADIAARTGYGTNTVSLALRGSTRISKAARDAIRKAADSLDYVPNHTARSLALKKSHTVGMLMEDLKNPSLTSVATALQGLLAHQGYGVLFATNETAEKEEEAIELFRARGVDGLLIYPLVHTRLDHLRKLRASNFPVVMMIGAENTGLDSVGIDEFQGAYDATTHLIALGHKRIGAMVSVLRNTEKLEGYRHALQVHGLELDENLVIGPGPHTLARACEAMAELKSREPEMTAIFTGSDIYALGVLRWARLNGVRVPEQLSIIGFDGIEFGEFAETSLSTIKPDVPAFAKAAADRLLALMATKGALQQPEVKLLRGELMLRESTARLGSRAWTPAIG